MSDYIIYNIQFSVSQRKLDLDGMEEKDKPVNEFPNYYLSKAIGKVGSTLKLFRRRKEESVPNCVLRNEGGIALLRVHSRERLTIYDLPPQQNPPPSDCEGIDHDSYPYAYVVVDCRDGKCQIAIEKTDSWGYKTESIRNCLQEGFTRLGLIHSLGIGIDIRKKSIAMKFEDFMDERAGAEDVLQSFTFEFPNLNRQTTARVPQALTQKMQQLTEQLELYDATSGALTMNLGGDCDTETRKDKLKQLAVVVSTCADNGFDLSLKYQDYGEYKCNESIEARYAMDEVVISHFRDGIRPDTADPEHDLTAWLDDVFEKIRQVENKNGIPTKPKK